MVGWAFPGFPPEVKRTRRDENSLSASPQMTAQRVWCDTVLFVGRRGLEEALPGVGQHHMLLFLPGVQMQTLEGSSVGPGMGGGASLVLDVERGRKSHSDPSGCGILEVSWLEVFHQLQPLLLDSLGTRYIVTFPSAS